MNDQETKTHTNRISLSEAAKLTGYHQDYLGQLCRSGKVAAEKIGRNWFTTEYAIKSYFNSLLSVESVSEMTEPVAPVQAPVVIPEPKVTRTVINKIFVPKQKIEYKHTIIQSETTKTDDDALIPIKRKLALLSLAVVALIFAGTGTASYLKNALNNNEESEQAINMDLGDNDNLVDAPNNPLSYESVFGNSKNQNTQTQLVNPNNDSANNFQNNLVVVNQPSRLRPGVLGTSVLIKNLQQPASQLTEQQVDDMIRFNLVSAIETGWIVGNGTNLRGCLQANGDKSISGKWLECRSGGGGGGGGTTTVDMAVGNTITGATAGSVLFVDASGDLGQDNANFFWDDATNRLGIGDATPVASLTIGAGDLFQVNSAGAIAAATGITSSGPITFSALGGSGVRCLQTDNLGVISVAGAACGAGGGQTPWTSAIDADGFALQDALNLEFRTAVGAAPAGTVVAIYSDNSGDLTANVITGKTFNVAVNGTDEYNFSSSTFDLNNNTITNSAGFNGLVVTANTGVITTGTWQGTAITDAFVSDTLTASLFVGSGSTTTAIDLATAEVAGILPVLNGGTGANTLSDLIALTTHTSGNYVATISAGNGISGTSSTEGGTPTIALGPLMADWDQTGAFDISLNNASSELRILESAGATFYGTVDVGDLAANATYTLTGTSGNILTSANYSGTLNGIYLQVANDLSDLNNVVTARSNLGLGTIAIQDANNVTITGGSITGITDLVVADGGTGVSTFTSNGVLYGNGAGTIQATAQGGANTVLVANAGAPSFSAAITVGTSVTSPTINATTALQLGGVDINTAGTLSNIAYLNQANIFSANQTITKDDATILFSDANSDTDFWIGVQEDADNSDDDFFQIGDGSTPGSNMHLQINTAGDVGIGPKAPDAALTISRNEDASATFYSASGTDWQGTYLSARRSRGTIAAPGAVSTGDVILTANAYGYANSDYRFAGSLGFVVEGAPSGSNVPTYFSLWNTSAAGGGAERLRVISTGEIGIGTTAPGRQLEVNSATGNNLRLTYNDSDGSAANYADLLMSSSGDLTITASGSDTLITSNFIVGSGTSATETLANAGFTVNGDDLFVAGTAGVEGNIYTDGSFIAGASTTYGNGSISQSSGETLTIGTTSAALTLQSTTSGNIVLNSAGTIELQDNTNITGTLNVSTAIQLGGVDINTAGTLTNVAYLNQANVFTANQTITKDDATILFSDANSDTDFWLGVQEDAGNDDDDFFQIGDGTTPGSNTFLSINTSGQVGIGIASPSQKLHVVPSTATGVAMSYTSDVTGGGVYRGITFGYISSEGAIMSTTSSNGTAALNMIRFANAGGSVHVGPADEINITSATVGIGTSAPDRELEINNASGNNLRLTYNDSNGSATNYADFLMGSSGDLSIVPSGGDAGITGVLSVSSVIQGGSATPTTYSRLGTGTTGHSLGAADDLLITDDLEVDGDAFFDGNLTVTGTCTGCGGGSQTPWTSNIDADDFDLLDFGDNLTARAGLTVTATAADLALATATSGNITLAPASTGSVQITSGVTTGSGTSSALSLAAPALTTGNGLNIASNSLTSGALLNLTSNGTAAANGQVGIAVGLSGTNGTAGQTSYGAFIANSHAGATSTNIGLYVTTSGGTTANYAALFVNGSVGIGTSAPDKALEINHATGQTLRLTYNDTDGSATNYADLLMGATGDLTIAPSGGDVAITGSLDASSALFAGSSNQFQVASTGVTTITSSTANTLGVTSTADGISNYIATFTGTTGTNGSSGVLSTTKGYSQFVATSSTHTDRELRFQIFNDGITYFGPVTTSGTVDADLVIRTSADAGSNTGDISLEPGGGDVTVTGTLSASSVIQGGSASTVAYSRLGTGTTGHSLNAANDLLISDDLEVDGDSFFDGNVTITGTCTGCSSQTPWTSNIDADNFDLLDFGDNITARSNLTVQGTNDYLLLQTTGSNHIYLQPGGASAYVEISTNLRVGLGTPDWALNGEDAYILGTLEVDAASLFNGNITVTKNDAAQIFSDADSDTDFWVGVTEDAGNDDDDFFQIGDGTTPGTNPFLTIDTSGFVGIGTAAPSSLLNVNNTTTLALGVGVDGNIATIQGAFTEAGSGTHALITGLQVSPPTITGGAAAVTAAASLYVSNGTAASGASNYGIWVDGDDTNRIDGNLELRDNTNVTRFFLDTTDAFTIASGYQIKFGSSGVTSQDTGLLRNAAGVLEVNSSVSGTFRDLRVRKLISGFTTSASAWGVAGVALQGVAATYTDTSSSGTVASVVANSIGTPTFAASSSTTFTAAANLYVSAAPAAGSNVTITNGYALWVDAGTVRLDGDAIVGGSTATAETLSNTGFTVNGDDLFVAGTAGVEGTIYSDSGLVVGASTTYANGSISQSSGEALTIGTTSADLTIQTTSSGDVILMPATNTGIGTATPDYKLDVEGNTGGFSYIANFFNDGDHIDRAGIRIQAGADNGSGSTFIDFYDGNADNVGYIQYFSGSLSIVDLSDKRTKTNITNTDMDAMEILTGLRVVDFNRLSNPNGERISGFIAQEVQAVYPKIVATGKDGILGLTKENLVPVLVKGFQEQQSQITSLQIQINALQGSSSSGNLPSDAPLALASHLYLSGDSVGEAKILSGATSVRISFSKPYEYQPIVTLTAQGRVGGEYWVSEKDSTGFTIFIENSAEGDITFDWHSFAGQAAKITVSDGTTEDISLVIGEPNELPQMPLQGQVAGETTPDIEAPAEEGVADQPEEANPPAGGGPTPVEVTDLPQPESETGEVIPPVPFEPRGPPAT